MQLLAFSSLQTPNLDGDQLTVEMNKGKSIISIAKKVIFFFSECLEY